VSRLLELVAVMDRLRRECPWDREQTHRSLAKYLLEETYETLEAIEGEDRAHLREELGDLLLQVYFHARIASERTAEDGGFDIEDVAGGIVDKLVHRHPHVFAGLEVADADEVDRNWERLKAAEKQRTGLLEGVPDALPALAWADKALGRLARAGRPPRLLPPADGPLGDQLLALVARAREEGLDAEQELRDAVRRIVGEPGEAGPDRALG
jgi:XTP/dITP diphosphohydrolase